MAKPIKPGTRVKATGGKHAGEVGTVEHSDKSITTVKFENGTSDPVWTELLVTE
jgi:ribosomal protein S4E